MRLHRMTFILVPLLIGLIVFGVLNYKLGEVSPPKARSIAFVLKTSNARSDFWQAVSAGAQAAAKEAEAGLTVEGPLQDMDADTQIRMIQEAADRGPDALVVAPVHDPRMGDILRDIRERGIKVVVVDTPLQLDSPPYYVANNHKEAGRQAGRTAVEATSGKLNAAIISDFPNSGVQSDRETGVKEALDAHADEYDETFYAENSEEKAYDYTKSLLQDKPALNTIIALSEPAVLGAAKALKERGQAGNVKLIGFDSSVYEIKLLEEGVLHATIVQKPFNMGYLSVKTALGLVAGRRTDQTTYIDSVVVTKSNMYTTENQKLLFPFIQK
ncbi:monosaccharide ABC transporter substrate-binding protein (CUT2 family) [Paenibacillus taihuensis]|uniref:Monosaccharide ABC transporter substrate-binding protein (CUT2 family) n=1 Tax=Paenibacillus taihuensis TaxID=1156355 RepID=A0A3D9QV79_9BACL|nr:substrate-binding domain-containing protein [Paenibacillus taihuensis]REE68056.1 monosaccharide ABC transporter substrate-binding protein (CUT2 family) [Paenibacillus taihuensis]